METQISISVELKERVAREASLRGLSFDDFVRELLERAIVMRGADPLLDDEAVFEDDGPDDVSVNHDHYLYGDSA